jgi:hypothetical protein
MGVKTGSSSQTGGCLVFAAILDRSLAARS